MNRNNTRSKEEEFSFWDKHFRFDGYAQIFGAQDLHDESEVESSYALRNKIRAQVRYTFFSPSETFQARSNNSPYFILSAESDYLRFDNEEIHDEYDLDFYETYLNWDKGPLQVRAGKQIVRWGKTDQISPVDVVNPQDMRQFTLPDMEERKIPNWLLKTTLYSDKVSLQGIYIPFFEPNEIDFFGTDWAVFRHLKQDISHSQLNPALKDYFQDLEVDRNEPSDSLDEAQFGGRLTSSIQDVDLGLSYFYGYDPTPHVTNFPVKNISVDGSFHAENLQDELQGAVLTNEDIEVDYKRSRMAGIDFETTLGKFGVRGESAYFDSRSFLTDSLTSVSKESVFTVFGADYLGQADWYANIQVGHQRIYEYTENILYFQQDNWSLTGELSKEFMRGKLEIGTDGVYFVSDRSFFVNPWISIEVLPSLHTEIGAHLFQGDPDTILGQYEENDQGYVKMEYYF